MLKIVDFYLAHHHGLYNSTLHRGSKINRPDLNVVHDKGKQGWSRQASLIIDGCATPGVAILVIVRKSIHII